MSIPQTCDLDKTSFFHLLYRRTYKKLPLKNRQNKDLNDKWNLMMVESIAEFCSTFDCIK